MTYMGIYVGGIDVSHMNIYGLKANKVSHLGGKTTSFIYILYILSSKLKKIGKTQCLEPQNGLQPAT